MKYEQAQETLTSIATARRKTIQLRTYMHEGSIISVWGLVWLIGFSSQQFFPQIAYWFWLAGWTVAFVWTVTRPRVAYDFQAFASWLVVCAFVAFLLVVIEANMRVAAITLTLVLAASYCILGIWSGKRFGVLGIVVLVTACVGWWLIPQWLFITLALGAGGALILGGVWVRRP